MTLIRLKDHARAERCFPAIFIIRYANSSFVRNYGQKNLTKTLTLSEWKREARRVLQTELKAKGISPKKLSRALESVGVKEEPKALSNKINRGTFSLIFFLQCMRALNVDTIKLREQEFYSSAAEGAGQSSK